MASPEPTTPAMRAAIAANQKLKGKKPAPTPVATPIVTPTATPRPSITGQPFTGASSVTGATAGLKDVTMGASNEWSQFTDGTLTYNQGGMSGGVQPTAYISAGPSVKGSQPTSIIITPSADGKGFTTQDADAAAKEAISQIPPSLLQTYKVKLKALYPSDKAFRDSLKTTTGIDVAFSQAVKKSLEELSVSNFFNGMNNAKALATDPKAVLPSALLDFNSYVSSRQLSMDPTHSTDSTRSLTTEADALQEFEGTTRANVGDPSLVNNYMALAHAYWVKLHATELARTSTSQGTRDPITGDTQTQSISYAQLKPEDRLAMQIDLITHGDAKAKSTGILNVDSTKLQEAGGLMGEAYTKIIKAAAEQGIPMTHNEVVDRVNKAFSKGGTTDAQVAAIGQLAIAHYQNLAPFLEKGGLTVKDVASQYQTAKEKELELTPGSVNVMDPTVQNALRGDKLPSLNDYIAQVRQDPAWRTTKNANEMAAGLVDTILKSWGKVG